MGCVVIITTCGFAWVKPYPSVGFATSRCVGNCIVVNINTIIIFIGFPVSGGYNSSEMKN